MLILIWVLAFALAITVHEAAHAYLADRLGDPTPRIEGRLSLNPLVHYDPVGTTLLLGLVILRSLGFPVIPFGWAKPVRFDPYNLANPRKDAALISLAGPASNIILAAIFSIILRVVGTPFSPLVLVTSYLYPFIILNVALAVFNLIPIHPLDGGKIIVGLLPPEQSRKFDQFLNQFGIIILFMLIFPTFGGGSIISLVISPIINFLLSVLIPSPTFI